MSTIKNRLWIAAEGRHSHRLIASVLASVALVVQAPVAGASPSGFNETPAIGILPFAGDVFTASVNGTPSSQWIPPRLRLQPRCSTWQGIP